MGNAYGVDQSPKPNQILYYLWIYNFDNKDGWINYKMGNTNICLRYVGRNKDRLF